MRSMPCGARVVEADDKGQVNSLPILANADLAGRPDAPILFTLTAAAARAAIERHPRHICLVYVPLTDYSPLQGRDMALLPGADEKDFKELRAYAEDLRPIGNIIKIRKEHGDSPEWIEIQESKRAKAEKPPIEGEAVDPLPVGIELTAAYNGDAFPNESNAALIFEHHPYFKGRLWFNEFSKLDMIDDRQFDHDVDAKASAIWIQRNKAMKTHKMHTTAVSGGADYVARKNPLHPIKQYLEQIKWDGAERLPAMMSDAFGCERNAYSEAVGRCWMMSAIARVYKPGCKADYMLVLEGSQGLKKSESLKILAGEWFLNSSYDPIHSYKEWCDNLQGYWIVEIAEMHIIAGRANGIQKIKGILSQPDDVYRKTYGRSHLKHGRQCIFAGTTNEDEWQSDQTGGRRFWPIVCTEVNLDYLRSNRDQLWAEALHRYKAGQDYWDVPWEAAKFEQEQRRRVHPWQPAIERYLLEIPTHHQDRTCTWTPRAQPLDFVQTYRVLIEAINKPLERCTHTDQIIVSDVLKALGYRKGYATVDGSRQRVYYPTISIPVKPAPKAAPAPAADEVDDVPY